MTRRPPPGRRIGLTVDRALGRRLSIVAPGLDCAPRAPIGAGPSPKPAPASVPDRRTLRVRARPPAPFPVLAAPIRSGRPSSSVARAFARILRAPPEPAGPPPRIGATFP